MNYKDILKTVYWECYQSKYFSNVNFQRIFTEEYLHSNNGIPTFKDLDMTGMNIRECSFKSCDISHINLRKLRDRAVDGCNFYGCDLNNIDFSDIWINGCIFGDSDISSVDFRKVHGKDISLCRFISCDLGEKDFDDVRAYKCYFEKCDLSKTNIQKARDLREVKYSNCKLPLWLMMKKTP